MEKRLSDFIQLFTACATTKQEVKHTCGPPAGRAQPLPPHPPSQSYKGEVTSHFLLLCQGFLFLLSVQVPVWLWCPGALSHCCLYRLTLFFFFFHGSAARGRPSSLLAAASLCQAPDRGPWTVGVRPSYANDPDRLTGGARPSLPLDKCL